MSFEVVLYRFAVRESGPEGKSRDFGSGKVVFSRFLRFSEPGNGRFQLTPRFPGVGKWPVSLIYVFQEGENRISD
ncbi:MAG: hypothetical protein JWM68_39 [Verrucomicrobiales bacterium]|nr:hypothetical protein [Verrucomicrobiales bacterium]